MMANKPHREETAPLLDQTHQRPRSTSSGSNDSDGDDDEPLPSYSYLVLSHALGLIPSLVFLVVFAVIALKARCHLPVPEQMPYSPPHRKHHASSRQTEDPFERCSDLLGVSSPMSWWLFLMGTTAYAAAHKVRNLISRLCSLFFRLSRLLNRNEGHRGSDERYDVWAKDDEDTATTILSFVSRAIFTEGFKILLSVTANAVVLAKTYVDAVNQPLSEEEVSSLGVEIDDIVRLTKLDPRDGRFRIAAWLALGWSTTELLSATVQLFRQLAMYAPVYLPETPAWDGDAFAPDESVSREHSAPGVEADHHRYEHGDDPPVADKIAKAIDDEQWGEADSIYRGEVPESSQPSVVERPSAVPAAAERSPLVGPSAARNRDKSPRSTLAMARQRIQTLVMGRKVGDDASTKGKTPLQNSWSAQQEHHNSGQETSEYMDPEEEQLASELDALTRLEDQIDRLVATRTRVKLEQSLGASLPELPVALAALWRLDNALWSVGSLLLLAAGVALGQGDELFSPPDLHIMGDEGDVAAGAGRHHGHRHRPQPEQRLFPTLDSLWITFTILTVLYAVFNSVRKLALSRWNITYPSLLVGLALVVAGLARWGLVV